MNKKLEFDMEAEISETLGILGVLDKLADSLAKKEVSSEDAAFLLRATAAYYDFHLRETFATLLYLANNKKFRE